VVDSYTGLTVFVIVWLGCALFLAGIGWVLWGDRRLWWLAGPWLFPVGWLVAILVTGWVLGL
jgi:hypothetical protein